MKSLFFILLMLIAMPFPAWAQNTTLEPICFQVVNKADFNVNGFVRTDFFTRPDGIRARHTSNFRLKAAGTIDEQAGYPLDRVEFCSSGPFYEGQKLELVIRTLFPLFSCRTAINLGDIEIHGMRKEGGGTEVYANCY